MNSLATHYLRTITKRVIVEAAQKIVETNIEKTVAKAAVETVKNSLIILMSEENPKIVDVSNDFSGIGAVYSASSTVV